MAEPTTAQRNPVPRGRLIAWVLLAVVLVAAVVQFAVNVPGGAASASPDTQAQCEAIFPESQAPNDVLARADMGKFRLSCERGGRLPR